MRKCTFVCTRMETKALHLEVVTDLTTNASVTDLLSRRGKCSHIYSHCGTNFVCADAVLQKPVSFLNSSTSRDKCCNSLLAKELQSHSTAALHLYERSVKRMLNNVMGETVLNLIGTLVHHAFHADRSNAQL